MGFHARPLTVDLQTNKSEGHCDPGVRLGGTPVPGWAGAPPAAPSGCGARGRASAAGGPGPGRRPTAAPARRRAAARRPSRRAARWEGAPAGAGDGVGGSLEGPPPRATAEAENDPIPNPTLTPIPIPFHILTRKSFQGRSTWIKTQFRLFLAENLARRDVLPSSEP